MAKIDHNTKQGLWQVQDRLESLLDHTIAYRELASYKADYRYVINRIEKALSNINEALDRVEQTV